MTTPLPLIRPFCALRPAPGRAQDVAARPYDVLTLNEARAGAAARPWSFLHVSRAEIDLPPDTDPHAPEVYAKAAEAMARMIQEGVIVRELKPSFYVYRMSLGDHTQTGLAAAASIQAYQQNRVRRHELTRPDKEFDRVRQIEAVGAQTGPVLVAHPDDAAVQAVLEERASAGPPACEATTDDGVRHRVWAIDGAGAIDLLGNRFETMAAIYIADGHHRSAAAARVSEARRQADPNRRGDEPYESVLIVSFPASQMRILDYNRVVRDLNGLSPEAFLDAVAGRFAVEPAESAVRPARRGAFGMYLDGRWHRLALREPPAIGASPVERLDVTLLSDRLLEPILGVRDPRRDPRIDFVGGVRGLGALEERVNSGQWAVAFALHPTALADLMAVADAAGQVMPPKSTWFEPKLADGLLSLPLD